MNKWFEEHYGERTKEKEKRLEAMLEDFISERNSISHGDFCQLLGTEELIERLDFVQAYARSLF